MKSMAMMWLILALTSATRAADPATMPAVTDARALKLPSADMQWWQDAKFGMFIHWGLYAIPAQGEWYMNDKKVPAAEYRQLMDQFNPRHYDPVAWVKAASDAGMKYMVLTARHHDGFCLFDDPGNNFTTVNTAAHRDVVKEYVGAVRQAGLHVGLYYSPLDWRFPGFVMPDLQRQNAEAMRDQYHRQMKELLSNYGKVDVVWFDGGEQDWLNFGSDWKGGGDRVKRPTDKHYLGGFSWQHDRVYTMLRELQPNVIITGRADMPADFHSREGDGALGDFDNQQPWELCTTLAGTWGYQPNQKPKSLKDCIQLLAKVAGRDGNLLLNVGPAPDGKIDPAQVARLREIGDWLGRYGASIYGTRGGPFLPGDYGTASFRDKTIYLHIINWPGEKLTMPAIAAKVVRATAMTGGTVTVFQSDHNLELSMTLVSRSDMDTVIVLELDRPANALTPLEVKLASNSSGSR